MKNDKEVVRLRQKAVSEGRKSLYLDIYVKGTRRYVFLRLYLLPDTSRANKEKNRETMRLANAVKAKRKKVDFLTKFIIKVCYLSAISVLFIQLYKYKF